MKYPNGCQYRRAINQMVKVGEINDQNPWWRSGHSFVRYDRRLSQATPVFLKERRVTLMPNPHFLGVEQESRTSMPSTLISSSMSGQCTPCPSLIISNFDRCSGFASDNLHDQTIGTLIVRPSARYAMISSFVVLVLFSHLFA